MTLTMFIVHMFLAASLANGLKILTGVPEIGLTFFSLYPFAMLVMYKKGLIGE